MPRCDGRPPNGVCPMNANGAKVKPSQGDLFLCQDCDEYRFPPTSGKNKKSKPVTKSRGGVAAAVAVSTDTASNKAVPQHRRSSSTTDGDVMCPCCNDSVPVCSDHIVCDVCLQTFHYECTGFDKDVFIKLKKVARHTGWVCLDCRADCRQRISGLQTALAQVTEKLSDVLVTVAELQNKVEQLSSGTGSLLSAGQGAQLQDNQSSAMNIAVEVHRTLSDASKRKCNIVVSGLPEGSENIDNAVQDEQSFLTLCEEHFSFKPVLSHLGCRRLGKVPAQRQQPRKLLVHLTSENSVKNLLAEAKKLRASDDPVVATSVYVNPDRSPAEAKLAFEQRQLKRERAVQRIRSQQTASAVDGNVQASVNAASSPPLPSLLSETVVSSATTATTTTTRPVTRSSETIASATDSSETTTTTITATLTAAPTSTTTTFRS